MLNRRQKPAGLAKWIASQKRPTTTANGNPLRSPGVAHAPPEAIFVLGVGLVRIVVCHTVYPTGGTLSPEVPESVRRRLGGPVAFRAGSRLGGLGMGRHRHLTGPVPSAPNIRTVTVD